MRYNQLFTECNPRKPRKAPYVLLAIVAVVALYAWMGSRDSEPQLSVMTYDCAPAMEMGMPIRIEGIRS